MSHLEEIEKLKEDTLFKTERHEETGELLMDDDHLSDLIDRAVSLGGKSVIAQLMENDKWTRESIGKEIPHP